MGCVYTGVLQCLCRVDGLSVCTLQGDTAWRPLCNSKVCRGIRKL